MSNSKQPKPYKEKDRGMILPIIVIVLCLVLIAVLGIGLYKVKNPAETAEKTETDTSTTAAQGSTEKWAEGVITYQGKHYKYNNDLGIYLMMGIDKTGEVSRAENYQDGGQSDAMFLVVTNDEDMTMKVISINRNTMADVVMYDVDGNCLGTVKSQICVQHGFGDGQKLSCNLAKEAVEKLFYGISIDGYFAMNVSAVPILNDFIGGVEVEVLPGLEYLEDDQLVTGETVTLTGEQAYYYLRYRKTGDFGSADLRLARQQQYIKAFMPKFQEKLKSTSAGISLFNALSDYSVSSISDTSIITQFSNYTFDIDEMYSIPGQNTMGESGYEEYIVDEDGLYDLIIQIFYKEVEE